MMAGQMAVGLATSAPFPSVGTLLHSTSACPNFITANCIRTYVFKHAICSRRVHSTLNNTRRTFRGIPRSTGSSSSEGSQENAKPTDKEKVPFGYSRKDVLLIGLGVTLVGVGLKSGLEFIGVDPLQAGNVVQLFIVLGLTVGWISTYMFRVANKDMTYAQQLRDYESKVMEKRLEGLTEAELQAFLEQVEEEKSSLASSDQLQKLN